MSNLIDQWNEHIVRGNQLSKEIEDFEGIMHVADMTNSTIAFYDGIGTTFIGKVLSPEKMEEVKRVVVTALTEARLTKEVELEKLMGRKAAYINPAFEAAVQDMEQSIKKSDPNGYGGLVNPAAFQGASAMKVKRAMNAVPDPVEEKLTEILMDEAKKIDDKQPAPLRGSEILELHTAEIEHMYKLQMSTVGAIADKYGVKKTDVNNFLYKHKLFRPSKKEDGFLDAKVQARQTESK